MIFSSNSTDSLKNMKIGKQIKLGKRWIDLYG
jgi:hypothetical protein